MPKVEGCPSGESPATHRKRLHSAEDARCSSRPPPEGAGSAPIPEPEEKGGFCQQCQRKVSELKRQALALADQNSLKVGDMNFPQSLRPKLSFTLFFALIHTLKLETTEFLAILQYFLFEMVK